MDYPADRLSRFPPMRQLLAYGLLTAPLLALIHVGPAIVLAEELDVGPPQSGQSVALTLLGVTVGTLGLWFVNIALSRGLHRLRLSRWVDTLLLVVLSSLLVIGFVYVARLAFGERYDITISTLRSVPYVRMVVINAVMLLILQLVALRHGRLYEAQRADRAEIGRLEAVQQNLLLQFQPHFLFNALATLRALITRDEAQAQDYAQELSHFMRNSILRGRSPVARLGDELAVVARYIRLQRHRFGDAIDLRDEVPQRLHACVVPVFTLQVLVENALKHNAFSRAEPLRIVVDVPREGRVRVRHARRVRHSSEPPSGTGLPNLDTRYRLLGGGPAEVLDDGEEFAVCVEILDDRDVVAPAAPRVAAASGAREAANEGTYNVDAV